MTRRRKTDGERITDLLASFRGFEPLSLSQLSARIDRIIRRRMAEAFEYGRVSSRREKWFSDNPYLGRKKK